MAQTYLQIKQQIETLEPQAEKLRAQSSGGSRGNINHLRFHPPP